MFGIGRRLSALEAQLATTRKSLGELIASKDESATRLDALRAAAADQAELLRRLDHALGSVVARFDAFDRRLAVLEADRSRLGDVGDTVDVQRDAIGQLRSSLAILERRFARHVDDATRATTALLERIELVPDAPGHGGRESVLGS